LRALIAAVAIGKIYTAANSYHFVSLGTSLGPSLGTS
jgi:hypothetical protein